MSQVARVLAFLVALFASATAFAQGSAPDAETIARARNHFNAGTAYYDDGRYDDAAREFAEAYRLTGHPDVLFNLASSYDRLERRDDAIEHYRKYLDEAESPPDRERIETRIHELETLRDAEARETTEATATTTAVEPPATTPHEESGGSSLLGPIGWGLVGLGVAAGVVAVITGLVAQSNYDQLARTCSPMGEVYSCEGFNWEALKRDGETMATLNTVFLVTGIAALAAGATLVVLDLTGGSREERTATAARLEITPGPGLVGAGARLVF